MVIRRQDWAAQRIRLTFPTSKHHALPFRSDISGFHGHFWIKQELLLVSLEFTLKYASIGPCVLSTPCLFVQLVAAIVNFPNKWSPYPPPVLATLKELAIISISTSPSIFALAMESPFWVLAPIWVLIMEGLCAETILDVLYECSFVCALVVNAKVAKALFLTISPFALVVNLIMCIVVTTPSAFIPICPLSLVEDAWTLDHESTSTALALQKPSTVIVLIRDILYALPGLEHFCLVPLTNVKLTVVMPNQLAL